MRGANILPTKFRMTLSVKFLPTQFSVKISKIISRVEISLFKVYEKRGNKGGGRRDEEQLDSLHRHN